MTLNEWLSIDKMSGTGDATITLTASSSEEIEGRLSVLKIKGTTKYASVEVKQSPYISPTNKYFWVKLYEAGTISGFESNIEYSFDQEKWTSYSKTIDVAADTYVWFRNKNSNGVLNSNGGANTVRMSKNGCAGGDLSSMGAMMEDNFKSLFSYGLSSYNVRIIDVSELILPWDNASSGCFDSMFENCTYLQTPPKILPATILEGDCYNSMFKGCRRLTSTPKLPAVVLSSKVNGSDYIGCYQSMFSDCKSLTTAPELPATILAEACYRWMFSGCDLLEKAPVLPATTLAEKCYGDMFLNCIALKSTPKLPATIIPDGAYLEMFRGCTALTTISKISTGDFSTSDGMFRECTSLTEFVVNENVYSMVAVEMFNGCSNLKSIIAHPKTAPAVSVYTFRDIATNGVLTHPVGSNYDSWLSTNDYYLGYYGWARDPKNDYFWVKLEEAGTITCYNMNTMYYSTDQTTWNNVPKRQNLPEFADIEAPANTYVWFKNSRDKLSDLVNDAHFIFSTPCSVGGDLSTIGDMMEDNFNCLFRNPLSDDWTNKVRYADELVLPWDTLSERCFQNMFNGNNLLATTPKLPATNLARGCYASMFDDCTNLRIAPKLPAITLAIECYSSMFYGCSNLSRIECYAENGFEEAGPLDTWVYGVSPTGTFVKKKGVNLPIGVNGIPEGWIVEEIS